jgi:hypothetical protein
MSAAIIKDRLSHEPFEPFRVCLSSGERYEVRHPEMALLVRNGVLIAVPDSKGVPPEVPVWCSFLHIAAVEPCAVRPSEPSAG